MNGLQIRQGTVYEEISTGKRLILINHNPMGLQSLVLRSTGADAAFDITNPEIITIDAVIELRKSGDYRELGDIPREALEAAVNAIVNANVLSEEETKLVKAVLN